MARNALSSAPPDHRLWPRRRRHMAQFGTTREQLADVAVAARGWANLNPEAFARGPLTKRGCPVAAHDLGPADARPIAALSPTAPPPVVLTRADRARDPASEAGLFPGRGCRELSPLHRGMPDLTMTPPSTAASGRLRWRAIDQADLDLVMLYDAFTINTILFLEDLGFCPKGEGGRFVRGWPHRAGGRTGGQHQWRRLVLRASRHVWPVPDRRGRGPDPPRGDRRAPDRPRCDIALCHGNGGTLSSQMTAILGSGAHAVSRLARISTRRSVRLPPFGGRDRGVRRLSRIGGRPIAAMLKAGYAAVSCR